MKKRVLLVLFVCVFVVVSLVGAAGAKDKIVIGQAISLSGPLAGAVAIAGGPIYELWVEEVNKKGGIYVKEYGKKLPVELKRYDDKSDIGTMTNLLEKLILEDKVDFIFPPWGTGWLFAAAPVANKYGYILIGGPGGALELKKLSLPYFFQVLNFSDTQAPAIVDIYKEVGVKSVALIYRGDLHGIEYGNATAPYLKKAGIEVKMKKSFPPGIKDLSPLLKEASSLGVDALFVAGYPDEGMLLTKQSLELGINFNSFLITVLPFSPNLYRDTFGKNVVEGVMGGGAWNAKISAGAKELVAKHVAKFKVEPDYWGGLYYWSSLQHFQQAIEKAGTLNQKKIRDIMAKERFDTALGPFWYDKDRYFVNHPGEIGQWQKGVFEVIDVGKKRTAPPLYPKPAWPK
ncbi:MAG: amino acid ABC transporter substrate-binding protein [Syntrophales bacterium]|jgi:branched-chain amino acid transport system substrate-binding protein|nr:amino acid ABC transporter substrate-binding protein [Syntrophales bacterium]